MLYIRFRLRPDSLKVVVFTIEHCYYFNLQLTSQENYRHIKIRLLGNADKILNI